MDQYNYYTLNLGFSLDSTSVQTGEFAFTPEPPEPVLTNNSRFWLGSNQPPGPQAEYLEGQPDRLPISVLLGNEIALRIFYAPLPQDDDPLVYIPAAPTLRFRVSVVFGTNRTATQQYRTPFSFFDTDIAQAVFVSSEQAFPPASTAKILPLGKVTNYSEDPVGTKDQYTFLVGLTVWDTDHTWNAREEFTFGHDPQMDVGM